MELITTTDAEHQGLYGHEKAPETMGVIYVLEITIYVVDEALQIHALKSDHVLNSGAISIVFIL